MHRTDWRPTNFTGSGTFPMPIAWQRKSRYRRDGYRALAVALPAKVERSPRGLGSLRVLAWLAWLAVVVWLTAPGLLREAEYFRSPGPQFLRLLLVVLAISPVALWIYQRARCAGF